MKPSYYVKLLELRSWREGGQANNVGYARRSLALGVIIEICFAVILLKIHNGASLSPLSSAGEVLSCVGRVLGTQTCCTAGLQGGDRGQYSERLIVCSLEKCFWIPSSSYFLQSIPASHIKQYCLLTEFHVIANHSLWSLSWAIVNP